MKKQKTSPYGTHYDKEHFTKQIDLAIPMIMKLGFSALEAHILDRLIRFSDPDKAGPKDVWASQGTLAYREGCSKQSVSRAISKAIKKKLIIVIKEAKMPPSNPNEIIKLEELCRHYNIIPLLLALANNFLKEEMEKEPEIEEKPKSTAKFGKAKYNFDSDDLPDEATRGWKNCKKCHVYGPPNCSCDEEKIFN